MRKVCSFILLLFSAPFLNHNNIFSCNHNSLNAPDETTIKVKFMDGKLESSVVLPKGLYPVWFNKKQNNP